MIGASLEQSLLLYPLVLGIYLSYQILKTTDLTAEGSFVLGAALYARLLTDGQTHLMALFLALTGAAFCGLCVCMMQRKGRMNALISSIIMLFMLYSINLQIMGRPNINLLGYDLLQGLNPTLGTHAKLICLLTLGTILTVALAVFLKTRIGLSLRAFGHHSTLLKKYGKNPESYRLLGLILANTLAALCGVLTAQFSGYADIHMGFGMALVGIGAVVMGQHLLSHVRPKKRFTPFFELLACFGGIYLYFLISHLLLSFDIDPINLRLCLGIILIACLRSTTLLKDSRHA